MLRHYIRKEWRYICRDKVFTAINLLGLTLGMATCLLILLYSVFELRYDRFHQHADRIYRITTSLYANNKLITNSALAPVSAGPTVSGEFAEVTLQGRLVSTRSWFDCNVSYTDHGSAIVFHERNLYYADAAILNIFTFIFEQGDPATALTSPFSAVITSSVSRKYFGDANAIGKVLRMKGSSDEHDYTVTGVIQDLPENSHLDAAILLSMHSLENNIYFKNFDCYTYLVTAPHTDASRMQAKLRDFSLHYRPETLGKDDRIHLSLQPVTDIHLDNWLHDDIQPAGNKIAIYFLIAVAFAILLIAWINYVNMTLSRAVTRAKEVGIRKVSGASRLQLLLQFVVESVIVNALSILLAMMLVYFALPFFNSITGIDVPYSYLLTVLFSPAGILVAIVFTGGILFTSIYPAQAMASYNPAVVLKGKVSGKSKGGVLRKALVVFQFTCASSLAMAVFVFYEQFTFMQRQNIGIDIDRTIVVKAPSMADSTYQARMAAFKTKLQRQSVIRTITSSSSVPGEQIDWTGVIRKENDEGRLNFAINVVDEDFIAAYKLRLLAGRNFVQADYPTGKFGDKVEPVMLNKTAAIQLGFDAIDRSIGSFIYWNDEKCEVIGIVDDYHQQSLKDALSPIVFTANQGPSMSLKLQHDDALSVTHAIHQIRHHWREFFPESPFEYVLLDDLYSQQYISDKRIARLFQFFCLLAIVISALGLFGLVSFTVRQRVKEVGIRKVLGASPVNLVALLNKEFLLLVGIASVTAGPIAYIGISQWLQSFAYHIDLTGWHIIVPVLLVSAIALSVISLHTVKAARGNPVDALKHE
jgi:putative ABC transport system permease protein